MLKHLFINIILRFCEHFLSFLVSIFRKRKRICFWRLCGIFESTTNSYWDCLSTVVFQMLFFIQTIYHVIVEHLVPFSRKSISEVHHWCWAMRPGSQSTTSTPNWERHFFMDLVLWGLLLFWQRKGTSLNCCHKDGSTLLSEILLCAESKTAQDPKLCGQRCPHSFCHLIYVCHQLHFHYYCWEI